VQQLGGKKTRFKSIILGISIILGTILLLSGCAWLNPFLYFQGDSGDKTTLPIAIEELIEMAEYCDEAYRATIEGNNLYEIRSNEFSYHVKQDSGVTILIFRGTDNTKNVWTDIDMRPTMNDELGVYLHRGFKDAANWLHEDITKKYKLEKTVYLTGHSLGGAIAQIMGLWLSEAGHNVQIYTFGSPKVSTTFFGNDPPHYRVAIMSDPVPYLPPWPYVHSGIMINAETLEWAEGGEAHRDSITEINDQDHSITYYLKILRRWKDW
jgi:hypothetical protein